jgi:hypothetical protein
MSAIKLMPNMGIWRTPVSINPLGNLIVLIVIAGSDILFPVSMISDSQISYVIN